MKINFEKILTEAEEMLQRQAGTSTEAHLKLFKKFLKVQSQRLKMWHWYGASGREVTQGRSHLVDAVIQHVFQIADEEYREKEESSHSRTRCAVVALGGYGRRDMAPFSDVDIMFLYPKELDHYADVMVNKVLYMLWDVGFYVGHSVRSIPDTIRIGREDIVSKTAMIEARFLAGDRDLFDQFKDQFQRQIVLRNKEVFVSFKVREYFERHAKQGNSPFVLEPDVKEGVGGARDIHFLKWIGHTLFGAMTLNELYEKEKITASEFKILSNAYDFILRVRTELHLLAGKRFDHLTLEMQSKVAKGLGYQDAQTHSNVEAFMREYFYRAREIYQISTRCIKRWTAKKRPPVSMIKDFIYWRKKRNGFILKNEEIYPSNKDIFSEDPFRLLKVFRYVQKTGFSFSEELKDLIRDHLKLIDKRFQATKEASQIFYNIMSHSGKVGMALRLMHETGVLGKYLPEFGRLTCMVQYDFYHRYTTDEHILGVISKLDLIAQEQLSSDKPYHAFFKKVENKTLLYFGLLTHDIGKGLGGGHSSKGAEMTRKMCQRLGLDFSDRLYFLTKEHLTMAHLSQRRDLNDSDLISVFAGIVKDEQNLIMLLLLTYCDALGTGPGVWNQWKEQLLWELYDQTKLELSEGTKTKEKILKERKEIQSAFCAEYASRFGEQKIGEHFQKMPSKYVLYTQKEEIALHLGLVEEVQKGALLVLDWKEEAAAGFSVVIFCTQDHPGLFAQICGIFSLNRINILSAQINTRQDGLILDRFHVSTSQGKSLPQDPWKEKIKENLTQVISGNWNLQEKLQKIEESKKKIKRSVPKIKFDNYISQKYTVMDVQVEDRLGLLFTIAHNLTALDLLIFFAIISTEKNLTYDVFYISDKNGTKIVDEVKLSEIKGYLEANLAQK